MKDITLAIMRLNEKYFREITFFLGSNYRVHVSILQIIKSMASIGHP